MPLTSTTPRRLRWAPFKRTGAFHAMGLVLGFGVWLAALPACGAGGFSAAPTPPAATHVGATTTEGDEVSCADLGPWNAQASAFEVEVLARVNQVRAQGATCGDESFAAKPPVSALAPVRCVARRYAKAMADGDFFDHTGKDGATLSDRVDAANLSWAGLGENIAQGQRTPADVMEAWLSSPGHCKNLMGNYTALGVGYYDGYWVQDFLRADALGDDGRK